MFYILPRPGQNYLSLTCKNLDTVQAQILNLNILLDLFYF